MNGSRFVTIHGHFYQPPRENPWLEAVEVQDSAYPFHDWNARITAECYAPNTAARREEERSRIIDIVNNFERISFNVGPTLLHWLAAARPDVYLRILEADRTSVGTRAGHGNAIAQAYSHVILPLASRRDKVTQVRWGLADFRHRFGREPEGMWLPETAVDTETLEVLAGEGIGFTILSPRQAAGVRSQPEGPMREVGDGIDPSQPYRWDGGAGRHLALFFYDGPISHAIAFEGLLRSGDWFTARVMRGFDERRAGPQLVHVATDGESYGHHHRFGEMALAAACHRLEHEAGVTLTNYGAFLAACPPAAEVQIIDGSSWSCAHGVGRWSTDCGCNSGRPGSQQRWRAPLRAAFDWLSGELDAFFESRCARLLADPWEARDDYIHVILDRSPASLSAFVDRHQRRRLSAIERIEIVKLLETQRQRLLMYTSCAWFFDEISGIETVQVLRYAARGLQLTRELGGPADLEARFVERLAAAPSNLAEFATGDAVYRRFVLPSVVDIPRVMAHYAIAAAHEAQEAYGSDKSSVYTFTISRPEWQHEPYADTSLSVGRLRVTSEVTTESEEAAVAVLHVGGHDFHCAVRSGLSADEFASARDELFRRFAGHQLADVVRGLDQRFGTHGYGVRDLFLEERRRILASVMEGVLRRVEDSYRRLYEDNRRLMQYLRDVDVPAPEALALAARYVLQRDVERALAELAVDDRAADRIGELLGEARSLGLDLALDRERAAAGLEQAVVVRMGRLVDEVTHDRIESALTALQVGHRLGTMPDLWAAQNRFFELWRIRDPESHRLLAPLGAALGFALDAARDQREVAH